MVKLIQVGAWDFVEDGHHLTATSLLFGLPMALLHIKRNLETAIAFHWFIDFARFLFGF